MSELFMQGLEISALAMGLTFAALGLLILVMILLERLFRPAPPVEESVPTRNITTDAQSEDEEIAAAIGVALAYFSSREKRVTSLGETLANERGSWWRQGQGRGLRRRTTRNARWQR